jgi:hypothetical protein
MKNYFSFTRAVIDFSTIIFCICVIILSIANATERANLKNQITVLESKNAVQAKVLELCRCK